MFWLGLLLAICYVPGYTGASVPTQWAVLAMILPLGLWRGGLTFGHRLFLCFGAYAALTAVWSLNLYSWGWGFATLVIWGLAYHWGTLCDDLRPLWKGLAVGLFVSVAVAFAQALDYIPVETADIYRPSGLFFNNSLLGVLCGFVIVGLACHRLWWYTPPLALGLILSGSRGGLLLAALGVGARYVSPLAAAYAFITAACAFALVMDLSDSQRLMVWGVVLPVLNLFGNGAGSFADLHFVYHAKVLLIRPEFVHNDILQLAYEYGLGALLPLTLFAIALSRTDSTDWPVIFTFCVAATFYFPLYAPVSAFIGLVVAGHLLRDWVPLRSLRDRWRPVLLPWRTRIERAMDHLRSPSLPALTRAKVKETPR